MPFIPYEEAVELFEVIKKTAVSVTISTEKTDAAEKECDDYLKNKNKSIYDMSPLSIYYVISKLEDTKQIEFIKNNINYIKEHEEDILLYNMQSPHSLSYFFSFNTIKELRKIDSSIFEKIISKNFNNLTHGFNQQDYIDLYTDCFDIINKKKNIDFINEIYYHNRFCCDIEYYRKIENLQKGFELQRIYNKEFMDFLLEKYKDKISTFDPIETLKFTHYIENQDLYEKFIKSNYDKINLAFENMNEYELVDFLEESTTEKQEFLIYNFFEKIIKKQDIRKIINKINHTIIIKLYKENKDVFSKMTLLDWIKFCSQRNGLVGNFVFQDTFKDIIDTFDIKNIEELFDTRFFLNGYSKKDVIALKYVETKYRNNLETTGIIEPISSSTSIFSKEYIKNLKEIKDMLKNNSITKNDEIYKQHLSNFILFLKNNEIIFDIEGNNFKEIEKLFYRIVMGSSMSILFKVNNIKEIALYNRIGKIDFNTDNFTVEQLKKYNVKQHKQLYEKYKGSKAYFREYKLFTLKLMLMVGYNHAKEILSIDDSIPNLEHLLNNVDVKTIKLDESGNPILNERIINLLFNNKNKYLMKEMLGNKESELYKYFPRIFSEWELIKANQKDKSLDIILEYLKSDTISIPPEYNRLSGLFKYIGCSNSVVNETFQLHDQMLKRTESTIPKVIGKVNEYSYEILDLQDMESLVVGNKTDCCFTVLGNGYSCLKHACTSKNGRILVIKKNNELVAHSWIWRNGDLLCLDNIEISKSINKVAFLDVYLRFADEIINESFKCEGYDSCIKNVTIGYTNFDKTIENIEKYPCLVSKFCDLEKKDFGKRLGINRSFVDSLPSPIEEVGYTDSKNVQYLIKGNGVFNLGQSSYLYKEKSIEIDKILTLKKGTK